MARVSLFFNDFQSKAKDNDYSIMSNFYVHQSQENSKFPYVFYPTPGFEEVFSSSAAGLCRPKGLLKHIDKLYSVIGNKFNSSTISGALTELGTLNTSYGAVCLAAVNSQILIVDGVNGYVYDLNDETFTTITNTTFPSASLYVTSQDGYFIAVAPDSQLIYISDLNDGLSWQALEFTSATRKPDNLVAALAFGQYIYLFGTETTEPFYNSSLTETDPAAALIPFTRVPGGFIQQGLAAASSLSDTDRSLIWLSQNKNGGKQILTTSDLTTSPLSSTAMSEELTTYSTVSDGISFSYQQEGHEFYVISFPAQNITFCYDLLTQQWHKRSSTVGNNIEYYRPVAHAYFNDKNIIADRLSGNLYVLSTKVYTEGDERITRVLRSAPVKTDDGSPFSLYNLVIDIKRNSALSVGSGQGEDPEILLRVSRDGGYTFETEQNLRTNKIGEYLRRAYVTSLGWTKETFVIELIFTSPNEWIINGCYAELQDA